jgi:hypothetical protein
VDKITLKSRVVLERIQYENSFQKLVDICYADANESVYRLHLYSTKLWNHMVPPGTKRVQKRDEHGRFMKGFDYRLIDYGISPIVRVDYK